MLKFQSVASNLVVQIRYYHEHHINRKRLQSPTTTSAENWNWNLIKHFSVANEDATSPSIKKRLHHRHHHRQPTVIPKMNHILISC